MKLKKIINYILFVLLFLFFSAILLYGISVYFNFNWSSFTIKPDWLPWDLILIFITSILILIAHLCELTKSKLFNKIRIIFFISISSITIVAVLFQMYKSYKQDLTIKDFEMHIFLQINADWKKDNSNKRNWERNIYEYMNNTATLNLKKSNQPNQDIGFSSHFLNIFFEPTMLHREKNTAYEKKIVVLKMKNLPAIPLYDKEIGIFRDFHKFKVKIKSRKFSSFKNNRIQLVGVHVRIYMNGGLRSIFTISDSNSLSVDRFNKDNTLFLSFDIKEKYGDIFYLLKKKISE